MEVLDVTLSLLSLGQLALMDGDRSLLRERRKPLALLVYLARVDKAVEREALAELLWSGRERELARKSLRQALSELRAAVGDALVTEGSTVLVRSSAVSLDANRFESEITTGEIEVALARWNGDFLASMEVPGGEEWRAWIETQRGRLRRAFASASEFAVADRKSRGDWMGAVEISERWLAHLPFDERACRHLVTSLDASGRRADAVARLANFEHQLRAELDVAPSAELLELGKTLRLPEPGTGRAAGATFSPSLIGRADAVQALNAAYRERSKSRGAVVLLEGEAGAGKSRLVDEWLKSLRTRRHSPRIVQLRAFAAENTERWTIVRPLIEQLADAPGLAAVPAELLAGMARVVPELKNRFRTLPGSGVDDLPRCVHRAVTESAAEEPVVLIVDDAAHSDSSSLQVLSALVRRPPDNSMIVLTGRPGVLARSTLAGDLQHGATHIRRISLPMLNEEQVGVMIASMAPFDARTVAQLSPRVLKESGGNPARVVDSLSKAVQTGVLIRNPTGHWQLAPAYDSVQATPRSRVTASSKRGLVQTTVLALAVLAVVVAGFALRPDAARIVAGSPVLLADVQTHGTEQSMGDALHVAATVALQQSRQLTVFPRARVNQTLALMGRSTSDSSALTEPVAMDVARRENIPRLLVLDLARIDSTYVLTSRLVDVRTLEDVFVHAERAQDASRLLGALDRLVDRIRRAAGESADSVNANQVPLPRVTTTSFDALRAYAEGTRAWQQRRYGDAHNAWLNATSLDSNFALAWLALSESAYSQYNDRAAGDGFLDRALSRASELSERERIRVQLAAATRRGTPTESARLARLLAERFPDRDTWYSYGTLQMRNRRCDEAVPALQKSLAFDSTYGSAWINIATCLQFVGKYAEAVDAYGMAAQHDSVALVSMNLNHEYGTALVRLRRFEDAERTFRRMALRPDDVSRAWGMRSLGYLLALRGRYRESASRFDSAAAFFGRSSVYLSQYRSIILGAQVRLTLGDSAEARRLLSDARQVVRIGKLRPEPFFLYIAMQEHVRAGMLRDARALRDSIAGFVSNGKPDDAVLRQLADARLLLAQREPLKALRVLDSLQDTTRLNFVLPVRGDALAMAGQLREARDAWTRLAGAAYFGNEWQDNGSRAHLRVAAISEQLGDTVAALAGYRAYLAQFESGDTDLPEVRMARRRLQLLSSR